jgi:ABC-type lipoprotein export system ATPase subunit
MEPLIQLRGVTKRYTDAGPPALNGIDLSIRAGAITAIMGPSGGGKSTLLNVVGGLDRPSPRRDRCRQRPRRPAQRGRGGPLPTDEGRVRLPVLPPPR